MAGPTSSILLENIPSELMWGKIEDIVQKISDKVDGSAFWVIDTGLINGKVSTTEGRPFTIKRHPIDTLYYSEEEILMLKDYVGFNPVFGLVVSAMCNREIDHKILGELTLYLAEEFNGLINFGGHLITQTDKMQGKMWEIPYETSGGMMAVYSIANVDFMRAWLNNKNFRMIK